MGKKIVLVLDCRPCLENLQCLSIQRCVKDGNGQWLPWDIIWSDRLRCWNTWFCILQYLAGIFVGQTLYPYIEIVSILSPYSWIHSEFSFWIEWIYIFNYFKQNDLSVLETYSLFILYGHTQMNHLILFNAMFQYVSSCLRTR